MSAEKNNVEVRELRNPGGPSRSFRLIRKDRVPGAKWALKGKKRLVSTSLLLFSLYKMGWKLPKRTGCIIYDPDDQPAYLYD